jgi:hypothetical protein
MTSEIGSIPRQKLQNTIWWIFWHNDSYVEHILTWSDTKIYDEQYLDAEDSRLTQGWQNQSFGLALE